MVDLQNSLNDLILRQAKFHAIDFSQHWSVLRSGGLRVAMVKQAFLVVFGAKMTQKMTILEHFVL